MMETRVLHPRRAHAVSKQRLEEENAKKSGKDEAENIAPKKPRGRRAKSEDRPSVIAPLLKKKSTATDTSEAKEESKGAKKKKNAAKQAEEIPENPMAVKGRNRRSKSAGAEIDDRPDFSGVTKRKAVKKPVAIPEESEQPAKKGRGGKKASPPKEDDVPEQAVSDPIQSPPPPKKARVTKPAKGRGAKATVVNAFMKAASEDEADSSEPEAPKAAAKKAPKGKRPAGKVKLDAEDSSPPKKAKVAAKSASKSVFSSSDEDPEEVQKKDEGKSTEDEEVEKPEAAVKKAVKKTEVAKASASKKRGRQAKAAAKPESGTDGEDPQPEKKATDEELSEEAQEKSSEEELVAEKPKKSKKPASKKIETAEEESSEENEAAEEPASKGKSKKASGKAGTSKAGNAPPPPSRRAPKRQATPNEEDKPSTSKDPKKLQNKIDTDYSEINFDINEKFNFKITSWNVAGARALVKKNKDYFEKEDADVICLNELKCSTEKEIPEELKMEGYHAVWNVGKEGGGVGMLSKIKPKNVILDLPDSDFEDSRRVITAEFDKFFLVSVYVVNAGRGLKTLDKRLEWNKVFDEFVSDLDKKKPVIIAGDMNVSHKEIDLANPGPNKKNAGFTPEEREGFDDLLALGFVDTFRHFYPDQKGVYTFWSYMQSARSKNVGWRLDYYLVSERFMNHVKDNVIRSSVLGSDHCPIVLFLNL